MPRRPKGATTNITLDQICRSVATSTAIETGEPSEAIEARLKARGCSAESESGAERSKSLAQPDHMANEPSLLTNPQELGDCLTGREGRQ